MGILSTQEKKWSLPRHKQSGPATSEPAPASDTDFVRFLGLCSGRDIEPIIAEATAYFWHLKSLTDGKWRGEFDTLFHPEYVLRHDSFEKAIQLCSEVAALLRKHGGISIIRLIKALQANRVFIEGDGLKLNPSAQSLVFSSLGWLSLLYVPSGQSQRGNFNITIQSTKSAIRSSTPTEMATRPVDELLRSFGDLLPGKTQRPVPDDQIDAQESTIKFEVSHLNMATMKDMANMKINWVDSLSAHLEFDPTTPAVSIFKCPSFCKISQSDDSIFAIMLRQFYDEDNRPSEDFSISNLLGEVMLSYTLLFRDDNRSRRVYRSTERESAALATNGNQVYVDPCLDVLCSNNIPTSFSIFRSPVRDSYDANADFPIFRNRLKKIQDYMQRIQPNRFMSVWRDRRDLRLWYTIWVVIILGVASFILSVVSMGLAAAQVNIARKAYKLQLQQCS